MQSDSLIMQKTYFVPRLLGYLGLLPFIISSLLVWNLKYQQYAIQSITIYAAVIVTFIGGVHWGLAMQAFNTSRKHDDRYIRNQFIFSVIPSLVAWLAVAFAQSYSLPIIAISFILFWYFEKSLFSETFDQQYSKLRNQLTIVATSFIALAWLGTN